MKHLKSCQFYIKEHYSEILFFVFIWKEKTGKEIKTEV